MSYDMSRFVSTKTLVLTVDTNNFSHCVGVELINNKKSPRLVEIFVYLFAMLW